MYVWEEGLRETTWADNVDFVGICVTYLTVAYLIMKPCQQRRQYILVHFTR